MSTLGNVLLALVRPAKGIDRAAAVLKWLWIPLTLILVGSVAVKASVSTPMSIVASQEAADAQLKEEMAKWPEADRKDYEESLKAQAEGPTDSVNTGGGVVATAAMVFAVLGAIGAIVYIATFFFVAAKTWANPVGYTTMLTVAALSLMPHALRNVVQTLYMSATNTWLEHSGLGALVAPAKQSEAPGVLYAALVQVDLWVLWGVAILFAALLSQAVGFERKRAVTGIVTFIAVTGLLQAVPTLVNAVFLGMV